MTRRALKPPAFADLDATQGIFDPVSAVVADPATRDRAQSAIAEWDASGPKTDATAGE